MVGVDPGPVVGCAIGDGVRFFHVISCLLAASACQPVDPFESVPAISWDGVVSDGPAQVVFVLTQDADGNEVGQVPDEDVCPPGSTLLGGRQHTVSCLSEGPGHVVGLTRSVLGATVRTDGAVAVCPASMVLVGQVGEVAVCASTIPGRVAVLTESDLQDVPPGAPQPECPQSWELAGFQDRAAVCRRDGEGSVIRLSRDARGNTVTDVAPDTMCPPGSVFLGTDRRDVLCDQVGPSTVIRLTRGPSDPVSVDEASCPDGWDRVGGDDVASVCLLAASRTSATLARTQGVRWPELLTLDAPCPDPLVMAGGDGQALVCVEAP